VAAAPRPRLHALLAWHMVSSAMSADGAAGSCAAAMEVAISVPIQVPIAPMNRPGFPP
jgi:hypothetical protein